MMSGRLTDQRKSRVVLALCGVIFGLGMFLMPGPAGSSATLSLAAVIIGAAFGGCLGTFPSLCADAFGAKNIALNYGLLFSAFSVAAIAALLIYLLKIKNTLHSLSSHPPCGVLGVVGEDQVGSGSFDRGQDFHYGAFFVQPAVSCGGFDHRILT